MRADDRELLRLAVPAFLTLVSEPLLLLADSAIVGRLGAVPLAGLGLAGAILTTVVSLCVFLAYGTTATVARHLGAGRRTTAIRSGIDGIWLAVVIGAVASIALTVGAGPLVGLFDANSAVADQAVAYLQVAGLGAIPALILLAATGLLRGLFDTTTPLVVVVSSNLINIVLSLWFVHGLDGGIAGAAWGTVIAQWAAAVALLVVVRRAASTAGVRLGPSWTGLGRIARSGLPLLLRTLTLRASLLVMTIAATRMGTAELAAIQVSLALWTFLAFTLDALAIAAQALTGRLLGAGDVPGTRALTRRLRGWGVGFGVLTGLSLGAVAAILPALFTGDPEVQALLPPVLLVAALAQPIAGIVFVLDGILIGAGDGRYLAWAGLVVLAVFAPAAALVTALGGGLVGLWVTFALAFMGGRAVALLWRERQDSWLTVG